jgi:hypothetical protein
MGEYARELVVHDPFWADREPGQNDPPVHVPKSTPLLGLIAVSIDGRPVTGVKAVEVESRGCDATVTVLHVEPEYVAAPAIYKDGWDEQRGFFSPGGIDGHPILTPAADPGQDSTWEYDEETGLVRCDCFFARVVFE